MGLTRWADRVRGWRWRAALADRRWLGLLAFDVALSLVLTVTPMAGRAWLLLAWGVLVYALAVSASAIWGSRPPSTVVQPMLAAVRVTDAVMGNSLIHPTEQALRKLNNPAALGDSALSAYLSSTIKHLARSDTHLHHASSPHVLRLALVGAIERLKPDEAARTGEQGLYHAILRDEYVLGHSTAQIMARYAISESTFHRYRRDAIRALANDLAAHEEALAQDRS